MRKSLWLFASLLAVIIAPSARADATYTYNFADTAATTLSWTLDDPNTAVIELATTFTTGITLNSIGSFFSGCPPISSVTIDPVAGDVLTNFSTSCSQGVFLIVPPTGLVDGTYSLLNDLNVKDGTLVVSGVTPSGVPEPSTIALLPLGLVALLLVRKRTSHPSAA